MVKLVKYVACAVVLLTTTAYAQKYSTRTGNLKFEASVPSFEEVAAIPIYFFMLPIRIPCIS